MTVGLVLVSHSAQLASGVVELAAQMAHGVRLVAAGGTDVDGIGTSFEKISAAIADADSGEGVAILCDLGSAILTAETALEFLDDEQRQRVVIADAPLVEGAVAAAVLAGTGAGLSAVVAAAESANRATVSTPAAVDQSVHSGEVAGGQPWVERRVTLRNRDGLHARPASKLVAAVAKYAATVTVNGANATSLLSVMGLGAVAGNELTFRGTGPQANEAVAAAVALVETGFGEVDI